MVTTDNFVFNDHTTIATSSRTKPPVYGTAMPEYDENTANVVYDSYSESADGYGRHFYVTQEPFHYPVPGTAGFLVGINSPSSAISFIYLSGGRACDC
jgi:hypothetical protein